MRSLAFRLVAAYALLLGSIAGFMYLYFPSRLEREAFAAMAEKAQAIGDMSAHAAAAALLFDVEGGIAEVFASARQNGEVAYLVLAGSDGRIVESYERTRAIAARFEDAGGAGPAPDRSTYRVSSPVIAAGDTIGTLHLGLSLESLQARVRRSREHTGAVALLVFVLGVLGAAGISLVVTRPLGRILRVVEGVANGDLDQRVGSRARDEVGYLARAFDSMVERLSAAQGELLASNRSLEERVEERTRALRREIDERLQAEAALRETEQRFRTMFESAGVGIALIAPDRSVLEVNPALLRMLGRGRGELAHFDGHGFSAEVGAATDEPFAALLDGRLDRIRDEVRLMTPAGPLWAHVVASAVRDADDRVRFALVMFENITEQKELAERLRQSQKLEAVGRLAGGIAHDFNNLLTTINGVAALMLDDLGAAEWLREDLEQVRTAGDRAASLTQQLLAFSRRQVLQPRTLDLNAAVGEMATMLRRVIGEDILLTLRLDVDLDPIRADPGQIAQVIMNLAVNSRDAMPAGGELRIETSNLIVDSAGAARYGTTPGPHVQLTVADTGHGMDAETRRNIFEPFFTTKEVGKGTGLGLATVYGIVKQSGGGIDVDTEPGRGTSFYVLLPSARDAEARLEDMPATTLPPGCETILLVEDEESVRALVGRVLRRTGYTVLESRTGAEAIDIAGSHEGRIDGVVTDVVMPRMSGPQLVERLTGLRPGLKVLFMSGYTRDEIDHQGLSTGTFGFIQKPMSPTALATAVRTVLDSPADLRRAC